MERWITIVLIFALVGAVVVGAMARTDAQEYARQLEAEKAASARIVTAIKATEQQLEQEIERSAGLRLEIERIRQVVPDAEVVEVVKWRTRTIEVPGERLFGKGGATFEGTDSAPLFVLGEEQEPCEAPQYAFDIRGRQVTLQSDAGNRFFAAEVSLWRLKPEPETELGRTMVEFDATEFLSSEVEAPGPSWSALAGVGVFDGQVEPLVGAARHSGRWSYGGMVGQDAGMAFAAFRFGGG